MTAGSWRAAFAALLLVATCAGAAEPAPDTYAGRPVVEVLRELRGPGLQFIYSSDLLPDTLRVVAEPASRNRLVVAREILSAHGLALSVVRPGLFAVVRPAQPAAGRMLRGVVVSADDGAPVAAARLQLSPLGASDWSRDDGRFAIGPVPEGRYVLRVDAGGFESQVQRDVEVSDQTAEPVIRLTRNRLQLSEVVVSTSRYTADRQGAAGALKIGGEALAFQPAIGEDAVRALGRLPGIAQNGLSAQSNVRGGESGELLTLLDGFPLRQAFHLPGYQSVFGMIDPGLVADAVVYTGGFPVRYGNRMGGVFDLGTIDADSEPRTALGVSVFNAMARHGARHGGRELDWLGAARVGTLRPIIELLEEDTTRPTYADVYARIGYGEPGETRITANVLWSRDELGLEREGYGESAQIESRSRYLWVRAQRDWDSGVEASLWLGHSTIDGFRRGSVDRAGIATGQVEDRRSSEYRELLGRVEWQPGERHWLEGGFEWTNEGAVYRYAANATFAPAVAGLFGREPAFARAIDLRPERERVALFAAHRWQVASEVTSEFGLRAQRTITAGTTAESWIYDPRLSLRWQPAPSWDLRLHWGRFHQTDEVHELRIEDGSTAFTKAQRSDQFIAGIDHRLDNGLALRVEWFRKVQSDPRPRFENLLDPLTVLPEIAPDRVRVAANSAEVRGAEISARSDGPRIAWWASLAWSEAWDGVEGRRVPRSWDQSWSTTAGIDWARGHWRFGAIASAHRGWPTTLVEDSMLGARNAERFPTRFALDLRAEYRKPLAVGSLALTFELLNAVNLGNACCYKLLAEDVEGETSFTTRTSDWLPLVPSLGVLWEF